MGKHMGKQLVRLELGKHNRVEHELFGYAKLVAQSDLRQKNQHVYDDKVFYNRWKVIWSCKTELTHKTKIILFNSRQLQIMPRISILTEPHFQYAMYGETYPPAES